MCSSTNLSPTAWTTDQIVTYYRDCARRIYGARIESAVCRWIHQWTQNRPAQDAVWHRYLALHGADF